GVVAVADTARQPAAASADPAASAAAPRAWPRHGGRAVLAVEPVRVVAAERYGAPVAVGLGTGARLLPATGGLGPGALPARGAGAGGRARAGDEPPAQGQDGVAGVCDYALPRRGGVHLGQGRPVHLDLGGARRGWAGARVQPRRVRRVVLHAGVE